MTGSTTNECKDSPVSTANMKRARGPIPSKPAVRTTLVTSANTPKGAKSSAIIYSLVETAKENNLAPYTYLNYLFERLPNLESRDVDTLDQLLPWNVNLQ